MGDELDAAVRPLPASYRELLERVVAHARPDERIRALWVSGSVARGVADAGSDLDLIVAVTERAGFAAGWRDWLAEITPTLLARPLPFAPGSFYATTTAGLRLDVVVEVAAEVGPRYPFRLAVFDRDGLTARVATPTAPAGVDVAKLADLVEEFFRQQFIFPAAVVARADWLLGIEGVHNARTLLYQLFVEANQPLPPMGVKQWSAKLTDAQRTVLSALPATAATAESVVAGMVATRRAWCTAGRAALLAAGVSWPEALDRATRAVEAL